jgi:hypothetical protein
MNSVKKCHKFIPILLALSPSLLWTTSAQASSSFNSGATLSYSINNITNLDNAGSLSGLAITGSFELAGVPDYALTLSGDGTVVGNNPNTGPLAISPALLGNVFSHLFTIGGNVGNGTANTSQLGLFGLNFENTGTDNYSISLTLNYQLTSSVTGQLADSSVALDYFNETSSFAGSDRIDASVFSVGNPELIGSSGVFNFTLAPGATEALYADVNITGNLEASPVPLPASVWLLFAGLSSIVSFGRRRHQSV